MNELEKTLQKILLKAIELAEKTGEFVIDQGTDLLQEFFLWHTISCILGILLSFFFLIIGLIPSRMMGKKESFRDDYNQESRKVLGLYFGTDAIIGISVINTCTFIAFVAVFCFNVYDLVFILVAPKLYLIEYFL